MSFEDPVFWKCAYIWKTSEEKVSKNTVRTSMRKTCKNHPKNEQKTHQKSSKNRPKKHTEKLTTQFQPKGAQTVAKNRPTRGERGDPGWNPPRKKKEYCKNQTYCGERVHAGKVNRRHFQGQHAPAVGRTRPGGESRLPAAIVPPPGLGKIICMRKICKKFDARSMQVYFFAKYCLKSWISPKTNQNEHPRMQNNPNVALHGTKRDPI